MHYITQKGQIPYFETVIRYLGGLLSAYAISPDPLLLNRAEELAANLDSVFNTTSGLARFSVDPITLVISFVRDGEAECGS